MSYFSTERAFFFSSRRRHTRYWRDWSSDVCSSDLPLEDSGLVGREVHDAVRDDDVDACRRKWNLLEVALEEVRVRDARFGRVGAREGERSEERRVGKEGRSRWSPYH